MYFQCFQSPYEEGNPVGFENECELLDHGIHSYPNLPSRMEEARNHHVRFISKFLKLIANAE